jgi:hypothetical protein
MSNLSDVPTLSTTGIPYIVRKCTALLTTMINGLDVYDVRCARHIEVSGNFVSGPVSGYGNRPVSSNDDFYEPFSISETLIPAIGNKLKLKSIAWSHLSTQVVWNG